MSQAPLHLRFLEVVRTEMTNDWIRLREVARSDPQRSGHGAESTWAEFLSNWLPPSYSVGTRKYIVPEVGADAFESDIVVFRPSYPVPLRQKEEVMAGGVAAAFSVKLTLGANGIRDAVERAARLRRGLHRRPGTVRRELLGPFPYGLLAHSHEWQCPNSSPFQNVADLYDRFDGEVATTPAESLDYICLPGLGTWHMVRIAYNTAAEWGWPDGQAELSETHRQDGFAASGIRGPFHPRPSPVADFLLLLLLRLSYDDPTTRPFAEHFEVLDTLSYVFRKPRIWELGSIFSDRVRLQLPATEIQSHDPEWAKLLY